MKRGRHDCENHIETELACKYAKGELEKELLDAERTYGRKKKTGFAMLLKPPKGE